MVGNTSLPLAHGLRGCINPEYLDSKRRLAGVALSAVPGWTEARYDLDCIFAQRQQ